MKIADFGESAIDKRAAITKQMEAVGTAGWAAPEAMLGKDASKASDVFSFGMILWELLTYRVPSVLVSVAMMKTMVHLPGIADHFVLRHLAEQAKFSTAAAKKNIIHIPFLQSPGNGLDGLKVPLDGGDTR